MLSSAKIYISVFRQDTKRNKNAGNEYASQKLTINNYLKKKGLSETLRAHPDRAESKLELL